MDDEKRESARRITEQAAETAKALTGVGDIPRTMTDRRPGYVAKTTDPEPTLLHTIDDIEAKCFETLQRRELSLTLQLPVLLWLDLVAEIRDRNPRNYSQLLRDDMMQRLNEAIDRLHEEAAFLVAYGPAKSVAERYDPSRAKARRSVLSAELRRLLQERED